MARHRLLFAGILRRRTTEPTPTMDDLSRYIPRHYSACPDDWRPAHTLAATRRRAQHAQHARGADNARWRPDALIEQTQALDLGQIKQKLAAGGAQ